MGLGDAGPRRMWGMATAETLMPRMNAVSKKRFEVERIVIKSPGFSIGLTAPNLLSVCARVLQE